MKFKFPYEVLMEHRKRTEEIARRDFFEVKNKLDMEMDTEKQMHERVKIAWEIRFEMQTKGTGAALGMCTEIQ